MKRFKQILIAFSVLVVAWSCEDDDFVAPNEFSDVAWSISGVGPNQTLAVNEEEHLSFLDVSVGLLSRSWTIESGNHFLNNQFTQNDTSLLSYIIPGEDTVSDNHLINVLFMNPGLNTVKLRNTYQDSVGYSGATDTLRAVFEEGEWVFANEFVVDVYAKIKPAFKVLQNGTPVATVLATDKVSIADSASWPTVKVEAGDVLTFLDETTIGRPETRTWRPEGGRVVGTNNDAEATFKFNSLGTYTNHSVNVARGADGTAVPEYDVWSRIPLKIEVIQSTKPFVIDSETITEWESEVLTFNVSGEVPSALGTSADFTVHVTNSNGFDQEIAVSGVSVNANDGTLLELTLADPIYNSDDITVSYSGGSIISVDERALEAFSDVKVDSHFDYSITDEDRWSFETEEDRGNGGNTAGFWSQHRDPFLWYGTTEIDAAHGSRVMRFHNETFETSPEQAKGWGPANSVATEPGTYRVQLMIYRPAGSELNMIRLITKPDWQIDTFDFSDIEADTWTPYYADINITGAMTDMEFQVRNSDHAGVTGSQTIYIDDYRLSVLELRP
ncbi:MAG: hypothetical protein JXR03_16605 [Cyclobacteriaceae bacterium]